MRKFCTLPSLMLFKSRFYINCIARINAVSGTTEHVDKVSHEV